MNPGHVIEGPYLADLLAQPEALRSTLEGLAGADPVPIRAVLSARPPRRVVLTGMGSSFHALHPLALRLVAAGATPVMVETSELVRYQRELLDAGALLVAVSQSGRSAETVRLLRMNRGRSVLIGVTNTAGSPLEKAADIPVVTRAGPEAAVSCKTYVATLAALAWLGDVLGGGDGRAALRAMRGVPAAAASYLAGWRDHVSAWRRLLAGAENIFFAGRGPSLAAVHTAGLIVKEAARFPAEGMSAAAFRHGPLEAVTGRTAVLVWEGDRGGAPLNRRLVEDVRRAGGLGLLAGPGAPEAPLRIPRSPVAAQPVLEILPAQMITLALAAGRGLEAGRFERASKVTTVE